MREDNFVRGDDFSGKSVAVVGFGIEGESVCDYFMSKKAEVAVFDERGRDSFEEEKLREFENKGVTFVFGNISSLLAYDVVVRSPGVPLSKPQIREARDSDVFVTSSTKMFFDLCPAKIIGVSGTKGKGTTSTLIYEMLKRAGRDVHLAGNIGEPMLSLLPHLSPQSLVVLELSSFQLQDLSTSPSIAVLLMIVPEHLDYHKDFNEYLEAKRNLVRFQTPTDYAIFNHDYPASNESDILTSGHILYISREDSVIEGCFVKDKAVYTNLNGVLEHVINTEDIKLAGRHNLDNVCAAVLVAKICNVKTGDIVKILKEFGGLEHRLELVRELDGVAYYNDSFSTIPQTTIAAIQAFEQGKVLILGGSSKNSDFGELGRVVSNENIRAIIGIGEEWARIRESIKGKASSIKYIENCKTMKEIVSAARETAKGGDVVLLSPACASFGMFSNYKERGNKFKKEVLDLS